MLAPEGTAALNKPRSVTKSTWNRFYRINQNEDVLDKGTPYSHCSIDMAIARHSPNTQKAIFEVATTLTNGHDTHTHTHISMQTLQFSQQYYWRYMFMGCEVVTGWAFCDISKGPQSSNKLGTSCPTTHHHIPDHVHLKRTQTHSYYQHTSTPSMRCIISLQSCHPQPNRDTNTDSHHNICVICEAGNYEA